MYIYIYIFITRAKCSPNIRFFADSFYPQIHTFYPQIHTVSMNKFTKITTLVHIMACTRTYSKAHKYPRRP